MADHKGDGGKHKGDGGKDPKGKLSGELFEKKRCETM